MKLTRTSDDDGVSLRSSGARRLSLGEAERVLGWGKGSKEGGEVSGRGNGNGEGISRTVWGGRLGSELPLKFDPYTPPLIAYPVHGVLELYLLSYEVDLQRDLLLFHLDDFQIYFFNCRFLIGGHSRRNGSGSKILSCYWPLAAYLVNEHPFVFSGGGWNPRGMVISCRGEASIMLGITMWPFGWGFGISAVRISKRLTS